MNNNKENNQKEYLGDSVYAEFSLGGIRLYLDNGLGSHSDIWITPEALLALIEFNARCRSLTQAHERSEKSSLVKKSPLSEKSSFPPPRKSIKRSGKMIHVGLDGLPE